MEALIAKVREIDPAAADYLEGDAKLLRSWAPALEGCETLDALFMWDRSPQGHAYWERIDDEINKENQNAN